jgi:ribosome-associated toxin RatA of RatAB toxin-antitoxin module
MPSATREIEIDVTPEELMGVITDFESYPEFIPEMVSARVVRQHGDTWEVAFGIHVVRRLDYTLKLIRVSPTRIEWKLVSGVFKSNEGSWNLVALEGGTRTHAEYSVDIQVGMFLPGSLVRSLVGKTLPAMLTKFKDRAESTVGA